MRLPALSGFGGFAPQDDETNSILGGIIGRRGSPFGAPGELPPRSGMGNSFPHTGFGDEDNNPNDEAGEYGPTQAQPTFQVNSDGSQPQRPGMPTPPPSKRNSPDNPFSKDNLGRTMLDIGSAFLANHDDPWAGFGAASKAIGARQDELRSRLQKSVSYGGPENQFEITQNPDGTRTVRQVPEFAKALKDKEAAKNGMKPDDVIKTRAQVMHYINSLPPSQRGAAYNHLVNQPGQFGLPAEAVASMPPGYDNIYGGLSEGLGTPIPAALSNEDRDRGYGYRVRNDDRNYSQRERRMNKPRAGGTRTGSKLPGGFILNP